MLRYNSYRPSRYERSRYVEGRFALASEISDIELEMIDVSRNSTKSFLGNCAIDSGWKVEVYKIQTKVISKVSNTLTVDTSLLSLINVGDKVFKNGTYVTDVTGVGSGTVTVVDASTISANDIIELQTSNSLLINTGEGWMDGLNFTMRGGKDPLVSGSTLPLGILNVPGGGSPNITAQDDPNGLGKIITFSSAGVTPTANYAIVVSAREQVVTNVEDPFLKNVNIPEATGQKMRLTYRLNVVQAASQTTTPVPYTDSTVAGNLVNYISVTPQTLGNGSEISRTSVASAESIDGRNLEITIRNNASASNPSYSGSPVGNLIPTGTSQQQEYSNGVFVDSVGQVYYLNAIFNDVVANQVILRIDKEYTQPDPQITIDKPYQLYKRDVYVTDDTSGSPLGQKFYPLANVAWNSTDGFVHETSVNDLRNEVSSSEVEQLNSIKNVNIRVNDGGIITASSTLIGQITWTAPILLLNPYSPAQSIDIDTAVLTDGGFLVYETNLLTGGTVSKGTVSGTSTTSGTSIQFAGNPDFSDAKIGNTLLVGTEITSVTAIDDNNKILTVSPSVSTTGSATLYLDTFAQNTTDPNIDYFVVASRSGNLIFITDKTTLSPGENTESGGSSVIIADLYDPMDTTLPTVAPLTIDGVIVATDDLVLFSNLSSNSNRIYKATVTGSVVSWIAQTSFAGSSETPTAGESVRITRGTSFTDQEPLFNSSGTFKINDTVRFFDGANGTDYWELGSIKTVTLADNTTNGTVFSVPFSGSENWIVSFSVIRGIIKETGQIYISTNGTLVDVTTTSAYTGLTGASFDGTISGSNLLLRYTTTSTGSVAIMKLHTARWSDSAGGPAGVPSYSGGGGGSTPAAGVTAAVQYKGGDGNLAGDSSFKWDETNKAVILDGLTIQVLQGPLTLLNNQASAVTIITYSASIKYTIIEYSLNRNGNDEVGSILVVSNGTTVAYAGNKVNTLDLGVTISASYSAGNVLLQYTSTNTSFTSSFKYSTRSWS